MKKFFALLALVMLAACNNDDDNNGPKKYATAFRIGTDETAPWIQMFYDNNNNLTSIVAEGETEYTFKYDGNQLISITEGEANETPDYQFVYENGKLKGFKYDEDTTVYAINYNESTKKYTIAEEDIEFGLKGRDLGSVGSIGQLPFIEMNYDNSKKGAMHNVPTKDFFLLSLFANLFQFVTVNPLTSINDSGEVYTVSNTYDADGYVREMYVDQGESGTFTIQYQYSE